MYSRRWTAALPLMVLLAMQSTASNAEPRIGVATSIRPNAESIVGADSKALSPNSDLYANETVRTGNFGMADLVFLDHTNFTVGPASEVLIDKYDPTGSSGIVVSRAARGTFRIATGSQDHRINTPYGTVGLLGTHQLGRIRSLVGQGALGYASPAALDLAPDDTVTLSAQRSVVEMVVKPPEGKLCRDGRPPQAGKACAEDCEVVIRLVEGSGATYRATSGKVANLTTPNSAACLTEGGNFVLFTSTSSLLSFTSAGGGPPPSSPAPPPAPTPPTRPPCVSPGSPTCG